MGTALARTLVLLIPLAVSSWQQRANTAEAWGDDFGGARLDESKWEVFTFEGDAGAPPEVSAGQLRLRGPENGRTGVRSRAAFAGEEFLVEATLGAVGPRPPPPAGEQAPTGFAILTLLFGDARQNRVEWILTSDRILEAWAIVDGRGSRLDRNNLGTKVAAPRLAVARRGDEFSFMVNGQVGLRRTVKGLPRTFRVMLYGFGSTPNSWDAVRVVAPREPPDVKP